jgi:ATP-binding cassette subfamily B protein RaxB
MVRTWRDRSDRRTGDMGSTVPGGQRQRLLLARALYKQPQALVLDEATSHVELACERNINTMLSARHCTHIIIAHRPETLRTADRVLVCLQSIMRKATLRDDHIAATT